MGVTLYVTDASFEANAIGFVPPVAENLEYWGVLGGTIEKTVRNLAPNKPPAETIGSPVLSPGFVTVSNANYIKTQVPDSVGISIIMVIKFLEDGSNSALASSGGQSARKTGKLGVTSGIQFVRNAGAAQPNGTDDIRATRYMFAGNDSDPTSSLQAGRPVVDSKWAAVSMVHDPVTHTVTITNLSTGEASSKAATTPNLTEDLSVGLMLIGSQGLGVPGYLGSTDVAAAVMYSKALDSLSLSLVYERLKGTVALYGINV